LFISIRSITSVYIIVQLIKTLDKLGQALKPTQLGLFRLYTSPVITYMVMAQLVAEAGTGLLVGDTAMYPYIPLEQDDAMLLGEIVRCGGM
jgi:hypothetical protein